MRLKIVSVRPVLVRGVSCYRVRWHHLGKVKRSFFSSLKRAEAFAATKRGMSDASDLQFSLLAPVDRERLMLAWSVAGAQGVDLLELVSGSSAAAGVAGPVVPGAGVVLDRMIAEKAQAGLAKDYLNILKLLVAEFIAGREAAPVSAFSLAEVKAFLALKGPRYRATVRSRLSSFFNFALRNEWVSKNPCAALERVKVLRPETVILSPAQASECLKFLLRNEVGASCRDDRRPKRGDAHAGLAWFILSAFAGLRPDEARKLERKDLHLTGSKKFIHISPSITKTGRQRIVYPLPAVAAALRWALEHGSVLPLSEPRKRFLVRDLRGALGLERWPKDVTRHSAASYWLAFCRDQKHVAEMLGHSEAIQRKHYKKPVEQKVAKEYFSTLSVIK